MLAPRGHALDQASEDGAKALGLADLAAHSIVTYHAGFTGRSRIDAAFAEAGLSPDIVMAALDADVIKTYVELGLGVGIVADLAFEPQRYSGLVKLPVEGLPPANTALIAVRRGQYLRGFAYRFIELCAAQLDEAHVRAVVQGDLAA